MDAGLSICCRRSWLSERLLGIQYVIQCGPTELFVRVLYCRA